ncbi:MAG TPA: helix-turn-helix domain-containing GNAT family N-acetyltransferase [Myxococcales bacterium]|nr:helix-turn-helix domain-containing GNAT family N-acetyltransferase [Myxococcales bacterium]
MARQAQSTALDECVQSVRRFNRFYTRKIGVLQEGLLDSSLSLTEARVLYELAHRPEATATDLRGELGLDAGYLSRIVRSFQKRGWLQRKTSKEDGRRHLLSLTRSGRAAFDQLDARSNEEVRSLVGAVGPAEMTRLLQAMRTIESVLEPEAPSASPYLLRTHRPGDMGWVVYRHGVLYSEEWGYDERFEALVAQIVGEFVQRFDPARERCWIAEKDGERVGSVFLVRSSKRVAKLRLLLVEPAARGLGIGKRLVDECIRFARQCRYDKLVLWTQSELKAARSIYEHAGFHLAGTERHHSWGRDDLVAETWELELG